MINKWLNEAFSGTLADDFMGKVSWRTPSNIAIVKYWGKHGVQLPNNPSVSFTLNRCHTETSITFSKSDSLRFDFSFDGVDNEVFRAKLLKFVETNISFFPFVNQLHLRVDSHNSFPHSSGIASSASAMSAFVMCLLDIERQCMKQPDIDILKASYFARLASGSASRSVYADCALWGETPSVLGSSDEYAVPLGTSLHPIFRNFHDSILIVSSEEKKVSSTVGHSLMNGHPKAESRYRTARENTEKLIAAIKQGDLKTFVSIAESEAIQLHDLMATSNPKVVLAKPETLRIIKSVADFRVKFNIPVCFTLDAGPNVHVLYPNIVADAVREFINNELAQYCLNGQWIEDSMGQGPKSF